MKRIWICALALLASAYGMAQHTAQQQVPQWYTQFSTPPTAASPWTFWYWMYGCVTDEAIQLDLQAMHDAGIAGFYLMPIKDTTDGEQYHGTSRQLSAEWWKRMSTVFQVADSLHLQMGIHFSDGFALGGGPWIRPEESMQKVVWSDTIVEGGKQNCRLPMPRVFQNYYEDIGLFAYPAKYRDVRTPHSSVEFPFRSSTPCDILFSYDTPFTLRSVKIITGGNNYQAHRFKIYVSDDGKDYRFVRALNPPRSGWQNTDAYNTYAIPATTGRYFKFHWTPEGSDPGAEDMDAAKWKPNLKVGNIILGSEPVIDCYEGKSGAVWRVAKAFDVADADCVAPKEMIDLSKQLYVISEKGEVSINLPKGKWHLLRMGHTSTGHTNATGGGGKGLECDKFSKNAINKQFSNWFAKIYNHAPSDLAKRVLTRVHVDSWECGCQNWSSNFAREFELRRGYSLKKWLPVYAGVPIASSQSSEKVLRDIRTTIAELINDIFFTEMRLLSKKYGCKFSAESVAPTMVSDGLMHYQHVDYPMGEFWLNSPTHDKPNDMLDAISGAHIYGKNIIQAEGFTEVRGTWDEHPAMLKPLLDHNYCMGINSIVFHVNTHNPWTDRAPGMTLDGIGTFLQRDNTWWKEMTAFDDYIKRCQALLQYGSPVIDLAVYTGDEMPRRSILPERLVTTLPGLFHPEDIAKEEQRLANVGQPLEVSPVGVTHTANMTKATTWVNPLQGYTYDSFNRDVLNRAQVEDGLLKTPWGTTYSALVIPMERKMNPDRLITCWNKIDSMEHLGLPVICSPWTDTDLTALHISKDIVLPKGIGYTHRKASDADIYFISNQTAEAQHFAPTFRAQHAHRYLANPMTGEVEMLGDTLELSPYQSCFVVLCDEAMPASLLHTHATWGSAYTPKWNTPWRITFEKTKQEIQTDTLFDWTTHADNSVKYYSGRATYSTTFTHKGKKNSRTLLQLGQVENIATVYVNGKHCGTLWMPPYEVEISSAIKKGKNTITIEVVNTWANALLGNDKGTPPFEGIWTNGKYRRAEKALLPAGLLGPISLRQAP